jgi:hypothetical protein
VLTNRAKGECERRYSLHDVTDECESRQEAGGDGGMDVDSRAINLTCVVDRARSRVGADMVAVSAKLTPSLSHLQTTMHLQFE